jgi:hypothetical protein
MLRVLPFFAAPFEPSTCSTYAPSSMRVSVGCAMYSRLYGSSLITG